MVVSTNERKKTKIKNLILDAKCMALGTSIGKNYRKPTKFGTLSQHFGEDINGLLCTEDWS